MNLQPHIENKKIACNSCKKLITKFWESCQRSCMYRQVKRSEIIRFEETFTKI